MKKTMKKLLAAVLSTALMSSALPMTMASAAVTPIVDDNFNDGTAPGWGRRETTSTMQIVDNTLAIGNTANVEKRIDEIKSGTYKLSMKVKPKAASNTMFMLIDDTDSGNSYILFNFRGQDNSNKLNLGSTDRQTFTTSIDYGQWYDVESIISLTEGQSASIKTIVTTPTGIKYRTNTHLASDFGKVLEKINRFKIACYESGTAAADTYAQFDDIKLEETDASVVYEENFDSFATVSAFKASTGWGTDVEPALGEDANGGKALYPGVGSNGCLTLPDALTTGCYKISYSVKGQEDAQVMVSIKDTDVNNRYTIANFTSDTRGNVGPGNTGIWAGADRGQANGRLATSFDFGEWYQVESIIDLDAATVQTTVTTPDGDKLTGSKHTFTEYKSSVNVAAIRSLYFCQYGGGTALSAFDNIKIEKYIAPLSISASDVTIKEGTTKQTNLGSVSTGADTVEIDFGMAMDKDTVTANSVYVLNTKTNSKVSYTPSWSGNVMTLAFDEELAENTVYNIVVTDDVESANGGTMTGDFKLRFQTASSTAEDMTDVYFYDNFDSYKTVADANTAKGWATTTALVEGKDSLNGLSMPTGANVEPVRLGELTNGEYEYSFSIKPTSIGQNIVLITSGSIDDRYPIVTFSKDYGIFAGGERTNPAAKLADDFEAGKWYDVKAIIKQKADNVYIKTTVTAPNGTVYTMPEHKDSEYVATANLSTIARTRFCCYDTSGMVIDNVKLKKYTPAFEVTKANITIKDGNANVQADLTKVNPFSKTVEVAFDLAMDKSTLTPENIYITDASGNKVLTSSKVSGNNFVMTIEQLLNTGAEYKVVVTTNVKTSTDAALSQNAEIPFKTSTAVQDNSTSAKTVYFNENFDGVAAGSGTAGWNKRSTGYAEVVADPRSGRTGNVLAFDMKEDNSDATNIEKSLTSFGDGTYRITLSLKPQTAAGQCGLTFICTGGNGATLVNFYGTTLRIGDKQIGEGIDKSAWHDFDLLLTVDGLDYTLEGTVTANNSKKTVYTGKHSGTFPNTPDRIRAFCYNGTYDVTDHVMVDDIKLEDYYPAPKIDDEMSFTFTSIDGTETKSFEDVSPLVNKITLDFGTKLKSSTVTNENIKLMLGSTAVDTVLEYNGGNTVTIHVADGVLKGESLYQIVIGTGIENLDGVALTEANGANSYRFATGEDRVSGTLASVYCGGERVEDLAGLKAKTGDITVNLDCVNSKVGSNGLDIYLIVAYYKDNEMIDAKYVQENIPGSIHTTTRPITIEASSELANADEVKVMAWDGFDTMRPISASITLN